MIEGSDALEHTFDHTGVHRQKSLSSTGGIPGPDVVVKCAAELSVLAASMGV